MNKVEFALNLLQDQNFIDLIQELRNVQLNNFENSSSDDIDKRQIAYYKLSAVNDLLSDLQSIANQKIIKEKRWKII